MSRRKPGERDYRDLKKAGAPKKERGDRDGVQPRWWELKGEAVAESIADTVKFLQNAQQGRMRQQTMCARLYGNFALSGSAGAAYARMMASMNAVRDRVTDNQTQQIIDTLTSRVGEEKSRPYYLTSGGKFRQQRKAKKLNQFIEGVFYEAGTYSLTPECFRDAGIWGDGFLHVFGRAGKVVHERVMGSELWVDEVEAQYGFPRNMYRVKVVDKEELAGIFPESRADIMETSRAAETKAQNVQNISDMVTVVEAWHLATPNDDGELKGGWHCIALTSSSKLLLEPEDYPYDFFPFARFSWRKKPTGYWSQGAAEALQGKQLELNKVLWTQQRSFHLMGSYKVMLQNGSKVVKEAINNDVGATITYVGQPPQYVAPPAMSDQFLAYPPALRQEMRESEGLNDMSVAAKKPAGLNSGKALREAEDIQSDRHKSLQRAYDDFHLQIARLTVVVGRQLAEAGGFRPVRVPGKRSFSEIDWKRDIKSVDDDEFVMQCFPVSRLSKDPAERLQTVQEYVQAGLIEPRHARRLLDFPDIEALESLANAQEELIGKVLDDIVDGIDFVGPEPTDDLALAKEMVIEYIQRFRMTDIDPARLDDLRTWNSQIDTLMAAGVPPPTAVGAPAPGPTGSPQANPAPPPVSDLLPNAPKAAA